MALTHAIFIDGVHSPEVWPDRWSYICKEPDHDRDSEGCPESQFEAVRRLGVRSARSA